MTAAESRPPPPQGTSTRNSDTDPPSSGFTAVNGRSSPSWTNGRASDHADDKAAHANGFSSPTHKADMPDLPAAAAASAEPRRESDGSNKRKRTDDEVDDSPQSPDSRTSQKPRLSPTHQSLPDTLSPLSSGPSSGPPYATQDHKTQEANSPGYDGAANHQWPQRPPPDVTDPTESRLMDALSRDNPPPLHATGSPQNTYLSGRPQQTQQHPPHPPHTHHFQAGVPVHHVKSQMSGSESEQKQRKRNFANRTKTGCMTCRERKKKCDEEKPVCKNCQRGSFSCKGYGTGTLVRPSAIRDHHPIQAKNGFFDPGGPPRLQHGYMPPPPPGPQPPSSYYGPAELNGHSRLIHEDHMRSNSDPYVRHHRRPSWADPHLPPYSTDRVHHGYPVTAPLSDHSWDHKKLPPPPAVSMPPVSSMAPAGSVPSTVPMTLAASMPPPATMQPPPHRSSPYTSSPYSDPRVTAQLALQHDSERTGPIPQLSIYEDERQKMTNQHSYDPNKPQLKQDRAKCAVAVHKFNKDAADPGALDEGEKTKRLRRILEGSTDRSSGSPEQRDLHVGQLGENVEVSAPFYCDYGYNITIGDNTDIGRNCNIMDACSVKIGARCTIGPDVSFYTHDGQHPPPPPRLHGAKRLSRASPIVIEDDVFIGGRAVILGGVTIARGTTVGANTTVKKCVRAGHFVVSSGRGPPEKETRIPTGAWGSTGGTRRPFDWKRRVSSERSHSQERSRYGWRPDPEEQQDSRGRFGPGSRSGGPWEQVRLGLVDGRTPSL